MQLVSQDNSIFPSQREREREREIERDRQSDRLTSGTLETW